MLRGCAKDPAPLGELEVCLDLWDGPLARQFNLCRSIRCRSVYPNDRLISEFEKNSSCPIHSRCEVLMFFGHGRLCETVDKSRSNPCNKNVCKKPPTLRCRKLPKEHLTPSIDVAANQRKHGG